MKKISFILISALVLCTSCNKAKQAAGSDAPSDSTEVTDENNVQAGQEFTKVDFCSVDSILKISADYPVFADNDVLNDSILTYVDATFRGYRQALASGKDAQKAFAELGQAQWESMKEEIEGMKSEFLSNAEEGEEMPDFMFNWEYEESIAVETIQERFVTMMNVGYQYQGGAHGISWEIGATFDRTTGKRADHEQLLKNTSGKSFQDLLKVKLAEDFECEVDALKDCLFFDPDEQEIPIGNTYLSNGKLVIQYESYEIAPYVYGHPSALFTFKEVKPYLSALGLRLTGQD